MSQMDLIDLARDVAIRQVEQNADPDWKEVAYQIGRDLAFRQSRVISEEIVALIPPTVTTHETRAMGAVMKRLQKEGLLTPMDSFVKSPSPVGHGRPSRVWRSLVVRIA